MHKHIYTLTRIHIYTYMHIHVYTLIYIHTKPSHVYPCIHIYTHTHTHQEAVPDLSTTPASREMKEELFKAMNKKNKSEIILPKSELQNTSTGRMGVERGLGLPSRPAPFLLSQDHSKTENQASCQARGQEKVTMKINPMGA